MPDNENLNEETVEQPVNCWQYARDIYLVGRSWKMRRFTDAERAAAIEFIVAMAGTRPAYVPYINLKASNPPAAEYEGEGDERALAWKYLEKQNDESLAKMIQKIGRSLKIQFCTAEEKGICDALLAATDTVIEAEEEDAEDQTWHRHEIYDVDPSIYEAAEEDSSSAEPESSSSEPESSSVAP